MFGKYIMNMFFEVKFVIKNNTNIFNRLDFRRVEEFKW